MFLCLMLLKKKKRSLLQIHLYFFILFTKDKQLLNELNRQIFSISPSADQIWDSAVQRGAFGPPLAPFSPR